MKLDALLCSCNERKINPNPSKRISGKFGGGCYRYRGRRKIAITTNRGVVVVPRGWLGVVRKKFQVKTKLTPHNKNIIIIHNNTSIESNEEDNRASSCVEPSKDPIPIAAGNKDGGQEEEQKKKPGDGVVEDKSSVVTVRNEGVDGEQKEMPDDGVVEEDSWSRTGSGDTTSKTDVGGYASGGEEVGPSDEEKAGAAIRIQTAFRTHLARRALRALKSLVRLQAVVRGAVVRRQARMALHCMRALVRLGDRVRTRQLLTRSTQE